MCSIYCVRLIECLYLIYHKNTIELDSIGTDGGKEKLSLIEKYNDKWKFCLTKQIDTLMYVR